MTGWFRVQVCLYIFLINIQKEDHVAEIICIMCGTHFTQMMLKLLLIMRIVNVMLVMEKKWRIKPSLSQKNGNSNLIQCHSSASRRVEWVSCWSRRAKLVPWWRRELNMNHTYLRKEWELNLDLLLRVKCNLKQIQILGSSQLHSNPFWKLKIW